MKQDIEEYDKQNGTELARFVAYLERGKKLNEGESKFFHVGNTGDLLQKYGMSGNITIGVTTFNKRHSKDGHNLSFNDWVNVIQNINTPIAIAKYTGRNNEKSFRIYTPVMLDGQIVCAGVEVHSFGKNTEVTNISTAFAREIKKIGESGTEELVYPASKEELKKTVEQFSAAPNSLLYPQQSDAKIQHIFERAAKFLKKFLNS